MGGFGESGTCITDNKRCNAVTSLTMDGNTYCKFKATAYQNVQILSFLCEWKDFIEASMRVYKCINGLTQLV